MSSAANAVLQNSINTSIILHFVRARGKSYRSEISKALNLSLPAVSRAVEQLLDKKIFAEKRIITDSGKKAHEVKINAALGLFVGITVELPVLRFSRMDMAGNILDLYEISVSSSVANLNQLIIDELKKCLRRLYIQDGSKLPVLAIGLALPAAVDLESHKVYAVLFQQLKAIPLKESIQTETGIPVIMENNENLAVLAEKHFKGGIPENSIVFITIHKGIGAGIFVNGELYRGTNGGAGEIGCYLLATDIQNLFEKSETFEDLASINRITKIALEYYRTGEADNIAAAVDNDFSRMNHVLIGSLASSGIDEARIVLDQYARTLAIGLANFLVSVNPQTMIIGGDLQDIKDCDELVLRPLRKYLEPLLPFPVPAIRMTRLGYEAAVIGAAQYALENSIFQEYPYILK